MERAEDVDSPLPYRDPGLGEAKLGIAWIRVGPHLMTDRIWLTVATGNPGIAIISNTVM